MHRAILACLITIAIAAPASTQQPQQQQPSGPWVEPRPHHIEKEWKRKELHPLPAQYPCKSTKPSYPNGYPALTVVPRTDGLAEWSGKLITWTPNDNVTECHIRQLYFWVATVYGTTPAGPDMNIYMTRHGDTDVVRQPLSWDIVSIPYTGATLYRVDAQQLADPVDPDGLQGDFDFVVDIIGTPAKNLVKPPSLSKTHKPTANTGESSAK